MTPYNGLEAKVRTLPSGIIGTITCRLEQKYRGFITHGLNWRSLRIRLAARHKAFQISNRFQSIALCQVRDRSARGPCQSEYLLIWNVVDPILLWNCQYYIGAILPLMGLLNFYQNYWIFPQNIVNEEPHRNRLVLPNSRLHIPTDGRIASWAKSLEASRQCTLVNIAKSGACRWLRAV